MNYSSCSKLIIVCAHAVFHGSDPLTASHWSLTAYQQASDRKKSEHFTFLAHIEEAVRLHVSCGKDDCMIVLSGGSTNSNFPHLSEAQGYLNAAQKSFENVNIKRFIAIEGYATDTFQNILFSILKFHGITSRYPSEIIVITHAFKKERVQLHREGIKWTRPFQIIGIDPEFGDDQEYQFTCNSEQKNATDPYRKDPYGVRSPLVTKRYARGWDDSLLQLIGQGHSEVVRRLLSWKGGDTGREVFPELLPWNN